MIYSNKRFKWLFLEFRYIGISMFILDVNQSNKTPKTILIIMKIFEFIFLYFIIYLFIHYFSKLSISIQNPILKNIKNV